MKTIKDMPEHSRPREKLREKGASALSDEELVAAILGMGTAGIDVRRLDLLFLQSFALTIALGLRYLGGSRSASP